MGWFFETTKKKASSRPRRRLNSAERYEKWKRGEPARKRAAIRKHPYKKFWPNL